MLGSLLLAAIGFLLIFYYAILTYTNGIVSFGFFFCLMGILFLLGSIAYFLLYEKKRLKKFIKMSRPLIYTGLILFIIVQGLLIGYSNKKETEKSHYTIVLGARIVGESIPYALKNRLNTALQVHHQNAENFAYFVLSGGQGNGERISEALAMQRYLVRNKINPEIILKEEKSTSTYENLLFSKEVIERHSGKSVKDLKIKIITNGFHLMRAKLIASSIGYEKVSLYAAPIQKIMIPVCYVREFFALVKTIIVDIFFANL